MGLMLYGVDELRNLLYKRKQPKRRVRYGIFRFLENALGSVYFVGPASRSLFSKIERGEFAGYDVGDILQSWGETGINAMANIIRAVDQAVSQERYKTGDKKGELKWAYTARRATDQALSFGLRGVGIPYDTAKKLLLAPFRWGEKEKKEKIVKRVPVTRVKIKRR